VLFFAAAEAAVQAGFRPCRRCEPQEKIPARVRLVGDVCRYIENNYSEPLKLSLLSDRFKVSATQLMRAFKQALGVTPAQYANACRLRSVKHRLREGSDVTSAVYEAGFGSSSRLYERTSAEFGMTPSTYGKGGRGMRVTYATSSCPLGRLLVASTERGLCCVALGDSDQKLIAQLRREYPQAEIVQDKASLTKTVATLVRHLEGSQPHMEFPLDIQATAFQRRVWDELRRIPYGATRSYSDIAKTIDRPGAARAVARACASNPVALVIPCHRVVSSTGSTSGYRWGKQRKVRLLDGEAASSEKGDKSDQG
jgi:AraC family transcriptional regulator of adaptative response/methylated-DNA-[protein]-cysteine methyltransferase